MASHELPESEALTPSGRRFDSPLWKTLHRTTLAFLEELMDQLDRWTYEKRFHSYRVCALSAELGGRMGLSLDRMMTLKAGSLLHDIGKIHLPQNILTKPGRLLPEEWEVMREHPRLGAIHLSRIPSLSFAQTIVRQHHERWNGSGYPDRLSGDAILPEARIFGVVDSYDAMISLRSYNNPRSHEEALERIRENSDRLYDPDIVREFLSLPEEFFLKIAGAHDYTDFIEDLFSPDEYLPLMITFLEVGMDGNAGGGERGAS